MGKNFKIIPYTDRPRYLDQKLKTMSSKHLQNWTSCDESNLIIFKVHKYIKICALATRFIQHQP